MPFYTISFGCQDNGKRCGVKHHTHCPVEIMEDMSLGDPAQCYTTGPGIQGKVLDLQILEITNTNQRLLACI
jgi:hypothetical protein